MRRALAPLGIPCRQAESVRNRLFSLHRFEEKPLGQMATFESLPLPCVGRATYLWEPTATLSNIEHHLRSSFPLMQFVLHFVS